VCEVGGPVGIVGEEMKDSPIVPDIDPGDRPCAGHVRFKPRNPVLDRAEPGFRPRECGTRNVEYRQALTPSRKKDVHEAGIPASNVDHSTRGVESCCVEQTQRRRRLRLKPTQFGRTFCPEHVFPVFFAVHLNHQLLIVVVGAYDGTAGRLPLLEPSQ
jgi:hypothetical protein